METQKISSTQTRFNFTDSDGRQTVKAIEIDGEKFVVVGEQFIAVNDLDKWIAAMQAAKAA